MLTRMAREREQERLNEAWERRRAEARGLQKQAKKQTSTRANSRIERLSKRLSKTFGGGSSLDDQARRASFEGHLRRESTKWECHGWEEPTSQMDAAGAASSLAGESFKQMSRAEINLVETRHSQDPRSHASLPKVRSRDSEAPEPAPTPPTPDHYKKRRQTRPFSEILTGSLRHDRGQTTSDVVAAVTTTAPAASALRNARQEN